MSGKVPAFITGATAKIKYDDKTLAYAQDVSYSTTVATIPIETMGRYEVVSNEPVAYFVEGTLSVIRYTAAAAAASMQGAATSGNDVNKWENPQAQSAGAQFDPGQLIVSQTFDLEVFQKTTAGAAAETQSVVKLLDCRFTRKGGAVNKRGVLVETFAFNAILAQDSSVAVSNSGDIDLSA